MLWLDVALQVVSLFSATIATLQAGSRVAYLVDHDAIGIMDGPAISRPAENETSPLFELSEAFRHCVRLSIDPRFYSDVKFHQPVSSVIEPYPMASRPHLVLQEESPEKENSTEVLDFLDHNDSLLELEDPKAADDVSNSNSLSNRLLFAANPVNGAKVLLSLVPPTLHQSQVYLANTPKYMAMTPSVASYYVKKVIVGKQEENDDDGIANSDWDHNLSTEAVLRYNSTDGKSRVAELSVFSPDAFAHLRSIFGIAEKSYRTSIFGSGPFVSFQSNSKGAARAGGSFFFTRDGAYMIKTIKVRTKDETKTLLKMLPKYHNHMKRYGRSSLLTRFCGMYGVRIFNEEAIDHGPLYTFVVMNAVFPAEASSFISERFDLKGSTVGREVSEEELQRKGSEAVLKDLDLAREVRLVRSMEGTGEVGEYGFSIGAAAKSALLSQLRKDVKLLVECGVMDYSLLVGVVDMARTQKQNRDAELALQTLQEQNRQLERIEHVSKRKTLKERVLSALASPIRLLLAPPVFVAKRTWSIARITLSSIITLPLPYYGSGNCGVDGGVFSRIHGKRRGDRAVYYLGLIDFLQPWTVRKAAERKLKGLVGYNTKAISCVDPEEYAIRFLDFLDANIS
eukprot:scaffold14307_cov177-Cylindrotheca_fusiformis.AAC.7